MLKTIFIVFFCLISLVGCGKRSIDPDMNQASDRSLFAMDTYMTMRAYGDSGEEALEKAEEKINFLESILSVTAENSDLQRINNADGSSVKVSEETAKLIDKAVGFCNKTDGALDITLFNIRACRLTFQPCIFSYHHAVNICNHKRIFFVIVHEVCPAHLSIL